MTYLLFVFVNKSVILVELSLQKRGSVELSLSFKGFKLLGYDSGTENA